MTKLGDFDLNEIYCGECSDMMSRLPDACIDLVVTSPPYDSLRQYNGYTFDFAAVSAQLWRVIKPGGVVVWVVTDETKDGSESGTSFRQALGFVALGFNCETMIYEAAGTGAKGSNYYYWQAFEYMFVFSKGQPKTSNRIADVRNAHPGQRNKGHNGAGGTRQSSRLRVVPEYSVRTNIWRYQAGNNGEDSTRHPAPFPEALARDHILSWSNPGDVVLDPMVGSGTTAKMAYQNGRYFLGFDVSQKYIDEARQRVAWANPPLLVVG